MFLNIKTIEAFESFGSSIPMYKKIYECKLSLKVLFILNFEKLQNCNIQFIIANSVYKIMLNKSKLLV